VNVNINGSKETAVTRRKRREKGGGDYSTEEKGCMAKKGEEKLRWQVDR